MVLQWVALCLLLGHVSGQGFSNRHCADFKTAVEGQPHKYIEMVNMAPMVRDCPPMTHFNQGTCDCSVLIIDTGHGTNIHGGVETSMHHSDPVDMGHDPMAADLANLPTSVLLEMLHQEQQISPPQFNVPTVPPPIPTQPVQSSWQEFTLPESGAKASLDQNQLVIRVPVDRPFDGTQFNQNVDQFSYVPTVEPIDPIVNMFGNAHAHQDFMIPTTTPVPRIEMYKPYVPETLANIPEVVAIITQIQQKVRLKTMAEQKRAFETFFKHFSANLAKYQSQKESVTDPPRPRRRQGIPIRESRIQVRTTPLPPQPRIVTFPPDATESPFPTESAVEVPLPPPPRSNIKDRTRFTQRISPNIEKTPPKIDILNRNEQPSLPARRIKSEIVKDPRRMSSSKSKPSDRIKSEFTKTDSKLTDVSETTKATKSNVQVLPKTLPPVKTTPKPEERPKTMKEILGILRRRLRKKGVPKEKITVSLLKSMISKDKKLIAMIRRSKKFIKKAKQNQESQTEQKSPTVQIQAKKDISRVKNTSDKDPTVLKTVRAVENKDRRKAVQPKDEHFKKQSDVKANRENAIQSKDTKAAKSIDKATRVINQNADGMKKAKTPMPSTKGTTRTVPRLPKIETSARMNNEKAVNVPIPPPPPPQVLAPSDRRSVKQRSFNIQITDKAKDISPNIVKTTRDSDVSVDSQSHPSAPVEESRDFFGMPPPPPPPPFV